MATIKFRADGLERLRRLAPPMTDREIAAKGELTTSQFHRVKTGKSEPGVRFIAGLLQVFGKEWFGELFVVAPDGGH